MDFLGWSKTPIKLKGQSNQKKWWEAYTKFKIRSLTVDMVKYLKDNSMYNSVLIQLKLLMKWMVF